MGLGLHQWPLLDRLLCKLSDQLEKLAKAVDKSTAALHRTRSSLVRRESIHDKLLGMWFSPTLETFVFFTN